MFLDLVDVNCLLWASSWRVRLWTTVQLTRSARIRVANRLRHRMAFDGTVLYYTVVLFLRDLIRHENKWTIQAGYAWYNVFWWMSTGHFNLWFTLICTVLVPITIPYYVTWNRTFPCVSLVLSLGNDEQLGAQSLTLFSYMLQGVKLCCFYLFILLQYFRGFFFVFRPIKHFETM